MEHKLTPHPQDTNMFVPFDGSQCDLEVLEALAEDGRIRAIEPEAMTPLYRKYGSQEKLIDRFEKEVGYVDRADEIRQTITNIAKDLDAIAVEGSIIVLDNKGENGKIRAYAWPYIGLQNQNISLHTPENALTKVTEKLISLGMDPNRVSEIELNPSARTQKGSIVAVFLGKE